MVRGDGRRRRRFGSRVPFPLRKMFGGKRYQFWATHRKKSAARDHARRIRKAGRKARFIRVLDVLGKPFYAVYTRGRKQKGVPFE